MNLNKNLWLFYKNIRLAVGLLVLVGISFAGYVYQVEQRQAAHKLKLRSLMLADELRRSSNDLTRMVRAYVVTGNPVYKEYYQDLIDIRDGKKPRTEDYIYWDLLVKTKQPPKLTGQATAYLDLIRREDFTAAEIIKLTEAKTKSDLLTRTEQAAMRLVEAHNPLDINEHSKLEHHKAIAMLFDDTYLQAKAEIMQPISDFNQMVEQRTSAAVLKAQQTAQFMCALFIALALLLLVTIELLSRRLNSVLGGSLKQLQKQIEQIGSGIFDNPIQVAQGMENSVLGWLAQTQTNLVRLDKERKQSEQLLQDSEEKFRLFIQYSPSAIAMFDREMRYLAFSSRWISDYGLKTDGLIGCSHYEIFPEIPAHWKEAHQRCLNGAIEKRDEEPFFRADGKVDWVRWETRPWLTGEGNIGGIIIFSEVVTERKEIENALLASEKELRLLADAMPQMVWVTNADGQAIYFNQQWLDYTGLSFEESCGNGWTKSVHPDDLPQISKAWQQAVATETPYTTECQLRRADNLYHWVLIRGVPVRDQQGKVYKWFGTTTEIHELKEKQRLLTYQIDLNQKIISESAAGIKVFKTSGECIACNRTAAKILNKTVDEVLQENFYQIPMWQTSGLADTARTCLQESIPQHQEISISLSNGRHLWLDYTFSNFISNNQLHLLVLINDVSEYRQLEQELRQAQADAQAANQAKSDFLANMSHEIRTPMNAVIGMSHLMLSTELNKKQQDWMKKIQRASNNLMEIITDILDFSKIESGKFVIEHQEFELEKLLEDVSTFMFAKAFAKALRLLIKIDPALPPFLIGDSVRLTQILVNYIDNAIKFSERGQILITAQLKQSNDQEVLLYFAIQDQGIGLTEAQQTLLFQRFQQVDPSSTRKYGGTGLGLSIAKSLAELMGGEVGVISEYGKGSTFWFTARLGKSNKQKPQLLTSAPETSEPSEPAAAKMQAIQGARVLLVEDDELNQDVAVALLKEAGLSVDVAENGKVALQKLQENTYQVVLMDLQMPVMDGIAASRAIRALPEFSDLPIIAMTANVLPSSCAECEEAGMNDHIAKPVQLDELWDKLLHWVKKTAPADISQAQPALKPHLDPERLTGLFSKIAHLLEESDSGVFELVENNEVLLQQAFAENCPPFYAALHNFDFDAAVAILKQAATALQITLK